MLPLMLNIAKGKVILVGQGAALMQRYNLLQDAGADELIIFVPTPETAHNIPAEHHVQYGVPSEEMIAGALLLMVAGIDEDVSQQLATTARQHNVLVNVEDCKPLCDFYMPSLVRRGDMVISISTGGKSPGLARRLRLKFETMFGPEWADRLDHIAEMRQKWRREGVELKQLAQKTDELIDKEKWL